MEEIRLNVGTVSNVRGEDDNLEKIKFEGQELATHRNLYGQASSQDDRGTDYPLYKTKKGKLLLYVESWSRWQNEASNYHNYIFNKIEDLESGIPTDYGDMEVPSGLITKAKEALGMDPARELEV